MNPNDNITWIELICKKTNSSYPETLRGKETLISIEGKKYLIRSNEDSIPFCEKIDGECWLFAKNLNVYGELIKEGYIPASSFGISEKETTQIIKVRKNPQDRKIPLILFKSTAQKNLTNPEDEKVYFPKEIPNEKNSSDENFPNFQFQKIESFINSEQTENSEKIQQFNKKNESSQNSNSETENMSNYEFHEESHDQLHEKVLEQKAKVADLKKRIMNTRNAEIMELPLLTKIAKERSLQNLIDDKNSQINMLKNQENSQNQNPLLKNTKDQEEMQKRIQILLQKKQYQEKKQKEEELENERKENQEEESEFERLRKIEKRKKIDAIVQQRMREKNKEMENKKNEQESNYDLQEVTESLDIQRVWSQDSFRSNISKPKNTIQNEKIQQILARKIQKEEKNTEKTPNKTIAINPVNSDPILSIMKKKHKQQAIKENILPNSVSKLQNRAQSTNFFSDESPFIDKQDSLLLRQGLQILYRGMNSESLVVYKSTQITREMMRSFYEKESFPEEMVRLYINSLNKRFFQSSNLFIFDIDFYPKLISEGLKSDFVLQQFSILEDKLFKLDQAIIPIKEISVNNQSYTLPNKTEINWSLAVVNFNRRVIVHFDLFPESDKLRILHDLMNVLQFFANIFDSQIFRSHGEWTWLTRMDLEKNYKYLLPSKKSTINNLSGIFMLNFLQMVLKPDFIKKNGKIDIGILKELKLKDDATFRLSIINDLISFYKNQALK